MNNQSYISSLEQYKADYKPGASIVKQIFWYIFSLLVFRNPYFVFYTPKRIILRLLGASIGKGLIIKPSVHIKYPWRLSIGNHCWIGEYVWIDNIDQVTIMDNCCISQGAHLLTGNHDFSSKTFDLITKPILLEPSAWVGAFSTVCPGVTLHTGAVLTVASVAIQSLETMGIYQGNPATRKKTRNIK